MRVIKNTPVPSKHFPQVVYNMHALMSRFSLSPYFICLIKFIYFSFVINLILTEVSRKFTL